MSRALVVNEARIKEKARRLHALQNERDEIPRTWEAREAVGFSLFGSIAPLDNVVWDFLERQVVELSRSLAHDVVWEVIGRAEYLPRLERAS